MTEDIVPELLDKIQRQFNTNYRNDKTVQTLLDKINSGKATYDDLNEYSVKVGEILSKSFQNNLSSEVLPDGKMYFNIADRILKSTLGKNYDLVATAAEKVQSELNKQAGIGLKAIKPKLDDSRIKNMVDKISEIDDFDEVKSTLHEPVIDFTQKAVDDAIQQNTEFQYKSGLKPKIVRTMDSSAELSCNWCPQWEGTWEYPNVPAEVFQRHTGCRCTLSYNGNELKPHIGTGKKSRRTTNTFR